MSDICLILLMSDICLIHEVSSKGFISQRKASAFRRRPLTLSFSQPMPANTAYVNACGKSSAKLFTRVPEVFRMLVANNIRDRRMCGQRGQMITIGCQHSR